MQRICKHGDIQNIILIPDKELNILLSLSYVVVYSSYELCPVFRSTLYVSYSYNARAYLHCNSDIYNGGNR